MAGIDKIYGTTAEYDEFKAWCKKHRPSALDYFYPREATGDFGRQITNLPTEEDIWLYDNCTIGWVVNRIREQYNGRPKG
jgi:hypothetical protein